MEGIEFVIVFCGGIVSGACLCFNWMRYMDLKSRNYLKARCERQVKEIEELEARIKQ